MLSCIPARRRVLRTHVPHLSLFWLKLVAPTWLHIAQLSPLHWQHLRAVMPSRKRSPKSKQMKQPKRARAYPSSFLRCGAPLDGMKTPDLVEKVASSGDESTVTTLYADAGPSGSKGDATDDSGQKTPTRNSRKQKKKQSRKKEKKEEERKYKARKEESDSGSSSGEDKSESEDTAEASDASVQALAAAGGRRKECTACGLAIKDGEPQFGKYRMHKACGPLQKKAMYAATRLWKKKGRSKFLKLKLQNPEAAYQTIAMLRKGKSSVIVQHHLKNVVESISRTSRLRETESRMRVDFVEYHYEMKRRRGWKKAKMRDQMGEAEGGCSP